MGFSSASYFLMKDRTVRVCGTNDYGQLGTGDTQRILVPTKINIQNVKQIAVGLNHTAFLLIDGTVKTVGYNVVGQLGIGNIENQLNFQTLNISGVKQVACGENHTVFLFRDGSVSVVGYNASGQLGIGSTDRYKADIQKLTLKDVKHVACGASHTMFLMKDGTVKACGHNIYGQLGIGNTTNQNEIQNLDLIGVKDISCGQNHTFFLMEDGSVKSVGRNQYRQLLISGNGADQSYPQEAVSNFGGGGIKKIVCGANHTIFVINDGSIRACGYNAFGQLGNGRIEDVTLYLHSVAIKNVDKVSCGQYHTAFLLKDGSIATTGRGISGQLGTGGSTDTKTPLIIAISEVLSLWDPYKVRENYTLVKSGEKFKSYLPGIKRVLVKDTSYTEGSLYRVSLIKQAKSLQIN